MILLYHEEVRLFIRTLEKSTQSKTLRGLDLLEKYGMSVGLPHVKKVTRMLYELRIRGVQEIRIFFVSQQSRIVLLHGFIKKSQKIPQKEIRVAQKRWEMLTRI